MMKRGLPADLLLPSPRGLRATSTGKRPGSLLRLVLALGLALDCMESVRVCESFRGQAASGFRLSARQKT